MEIAVFVNTALERELMLSALREVVPTVHFASDKSLETKIGKEKLQEASEYMSTYLDGGVSQKLSKNEQLSLTVQLLRYLTGYMKSMSIPITISNLVSNLGLLPEAVDNLFPSYKEARLLRYIIAYGSATSIR